MSLAIVFFFNDTATTEIYTLSLHDALPICEFSICRELGNGRSVMVRHIPLAAGAWVTTHDDITEFKARERSSIELRDRKSTRLNSSHANISYAVFCLKKKRIHSSRQNETLA